MQWRENAQDQKGERETGEEREGVRLSVRKMEIEDMKDERCRGYEGERMSAVLLSMTLY